jgi:hypothetical protein
MRGALGYIEALINNHAFIMRLESRALSQMQQMQRLPKNMGHLIIHIPENAIQARQRGAIPGYSYEWISVLGQDHRSYNGNVEQEDKDMIVVQSFNIAQMHFS